MQYMVVVSGNAIYGGGVRYCNIWWWCLVMQYMVVVSDNAISGGGVW